MGTLNIRRRIMLGYSKRDLNFDNHPYRVYTKNALNSSERYAQRLQQLLIQEYALKHIRDPTII